MKNINLSPEKSHGYFYLARFLTEVVTLEDERRKLNYLNPFIGCDSPTVAHHIAHTVIVGRALAVFAEKNKQNVDKIALDNLTLYHDLPEARYGDISRDERVYVTINEDKARVDAYGHLPFGKEIIGIIERFEETGTDFTTLLSRDSDVIYVILTIKDLLAKGIIVRNTEQRFANTIRRLKTDEGKALANQIVTMQYDKMWPFLTKTVNIKNVALPLSDSITTKLVASWVLKRLEEKNLPDSELFNQVLARNNTDALAHDAAVLYTIIQMKRDIVKGKEITDDTISQQVNTLKTENGRIMGNLLSEINLYDWLDIMRGFLEVAPDGSTQKVIKNK